MRKQSRDLTRYRVAKKDLKLNRLAVVAEMDDEYQLMIRHIKREKHRREKEKLSALHMQLE